MNRECIFPVSPKQAGWLFVIKYGYKGVMVTDSTVELAQNTAAGYFSRLGPEELADMELHPALVKRLDFISGLVEITQILGTRDAEIAYQEAWDANPHFEQEQIAQLESQFLL